VSDVVHPRVAVFDLDGTVTTRDCVVPFLRRVGGTSAVAGRLVYRTGSILPLLTRRDRDALKAVAAHAAFAGRPAAEVLAEGRHFAEIVHRRWLRSDTMGAMAAHRDAGDTVVVVSASFEAYVLPLGERLGVDGALGTRLEVGPDGRHTGRLDGPNCRGPEKVRRLHAWLDAHHGGRPAVQVVAYGDSVGDRELLADADVAHWVLPPRRRAS
jgi:phosphatidylglycerophosphatase C